MSNTENTEVDNVINEQNTDCQELKNIQYRTMLLTGTKIQTTKSTDNIILLDNYLEQEKNNNMNETWTKLNKTIKTKKLLEYVEIYKEKNKLNDDEVAKLIVFLKDCVDRKKLNRVKDVIYDKKMGIIKDIPGLFHSKQNNHYTLKNIDKRVSTLKSLMSKKTSQGSIKNKTETDIP